MKSIVQIYTQHMEENIHYEEPETHTCGIRRKIIPFDYIDEIQTFIEFSSSKLNALRRNY